MNFLKNKHLILAMLIAPVLALIAYFATDYAVREKPQAAQAGAAYKLAASSNCRYQSGACSLRNADLKLELSAERLATQRVKIAMQANLPLQQALLAVSQPAGDERPETMEQGVDAQHWQLVVPIADTSSDKLRVAVTVDGAHYYVEVPSIFVDYETTFSQDNFSNK